MAKGGRVGKMRALLVVRQLEPLSVGKLRLMA